MPMTISPISKKSAAIIKRALTAGDAEMLASVDPEYANFYCRSCNSSYCADHSFKESVYDEEFYDCTYGTCPAGHRSKIDD
jgi:hypothetical protein